MSGTDDLYEEWDRADIADAGEALTAIAGLFERRPVALTDREHLREAMAVLTTSETTIRNLLHILDRRWPERITEAGS